MKQIASRSVLALWIIVLFVQGAQAGKLTADMKEGKPAFQSMGPLAFGPEAFSSLPIPKGRRLSLSRPVTPHRLQAPNC
jgi:hypothetical protein